MSEEVQEGEEKPSGGGGNKMIMILLILIVILLFGVIGVGVMLMMNQSAEQKGGANTEQVEDHSEGDHDGDTGHAQGYSPKYKQYEPPAEHGEPQYFIMEGNIVRFRGEGKATHLAVDMQFMTYYPQLVADLEKYRPEIKNNMISLMRRQTYTAMDAEDGQEVLAAQVLESIRGTMERHKIYPDLVENVFFTRFVMQ